MHDIIIKKFGVSTIKKKKKKKGHKKLIEMNTKDIYNITKYFFPK